MAKKQTKKPITSNIILPDTQIADSSQGERAAMIGYNAQYDIFAEFAYEKLLHNLEWIRIADTYAGQLDDVQYATPDAIYAYQIKWTNDDKQQLSFSDFSKLLIKIVKSWQEIQTLPHASGKKIFPTLLTNKPLSQDSEIPSHKVDTFADFEREVLKKYNSKQPIEDKWIPVIEALRKETSLDEATWRTFMCDFRFWHTYHRNPPFQPQQYEDLQQFSRFIQGQVGNRSKQIHFTRLEILKALNWENRFQTTFNHDLVVDWNKYQPIQATISALNAKLNTFSSGYLFLVGGPGTGKSTLLTAWAQNLTDFVFKYYAFDFNNPGSRLNYAQRGDATQLFFDLVIALKSSGIYGESVAPYRDLIFLKRIFFNQLKYASQKFQKEGKKTIIIIDGLDHVPREYSKNAATMIQSFLRELPHPQEIPTGVYLVLGSQSYDFEDIAYEIKKEYKNTDRTISIRALSKPEVMNYLEKSDLKITLSDNLKLKLYEKSQGHPLYLAYLTEMIRQSAEVDATIDASMPINGSIDTYYRNIWEAFQANITLTDFMGLIARINGSIPISFLEEWKYDRQVLSIFRAKMLFLFNKTNGIWSFFHNSFKQFLLSNTTISDLTGEFDSQKEVDFHQQLAVYYQNSKSQPAWKQNYHLFHAELYAEFMEKVHPERFIEQLLAFRPAAEIREDALLGVKIAQKQQNVPLLTRFLGGLTELERRSRYLEVEKWVPLLLQLGLKAEALSFLRNENALIAAPEAVLKVIPEFIRQGHPVESSLLFNLAYPSCIREQGIFIPERYYREDIEAVLIHWVKCAIYFMDEAVIIDKILNIKFAEQTNLNAEDQRELQPKLLYQFADTLIELKKWDSFDKIIALLQTLEQNIFYLLKSAVEFCIENKLYDVSKKYLNLILTHFTKENTDNEIKIYIANLLYKVHKSTDMALEWVKDIKLESVLRQNRHTVEDWNVCALFVILSKLRLLHNKSLKMAEALPNALRGKDEVLLGAFERKLYQIAEILTDGILQRNLSINIVRRVKPIVTFYYQNFREIDPNYPYFIIRVKKDYFDYLIYAVAQLSPVHLEALGDYLWDEFKQNPIYWDSKDQRAVLESLHVNGYNPAPLKTQLLVNQSLIKANQTIHERVEEYLEQTQLWLDLKEDTQATIALRKVITTAMGVESRKDEQFSSWVTWLKLILPELSKSQGIETIHWFLSHLAHVEASTENANYSIELLEATFQWNFTVGYNQLIWLLNQGLIGFQTGMNCFIECFIAHITTEITFICISNLYLELFLWIRTGHYCPILEPLLRKAHELAPDRFGTVYLPQFVHAIQIKALKESRPTLLAGVERVCKSLNVNILDFCPSFTIPENPHPDSRHPNQLILSTDNRPISEAAVLEEVQDFKSFVRLLRAEDKLKSSFDWLPVLDKILPQISVADIWTLTKIIEIKDYRICLFYAKCSERAFQLGEIGAAKTLAQTSLEKSSNWIAYIDGGTRIIALNALKKIDSQAAAQQTFTLLSDDLVRSKWFNGYLSEFHKIVPLLKSDADKLLPVWAEIWDYLKRLMSNSPPIMDLPSSEVSDPLPLAALIDYLLYLSVHPIPVMSEQARKILALNIHKGEIHTLRRLTALPLNIESNADLVHDVMMHLWELKATQLIDFKLVAIELSVSKNYLFRTNARLILDYLAVPKPKIAPISLPPIYALVLDLPAYLQMDRQTPYTEVDINNPIDTIRPFRFLLNLLAEAAGIEEMNLLYRHHQWMKTIGNPSDWSLDAEKQLHHKLEAVRLNESFPRNRVMIAKKALFHLVAELIDVGKIDIRERYLLQLFTSADYSAAFFPLVPKPSFIPVLGGSKYEDRGLSTNWLEEIQNAERLANPHLIHFNQNVVIGEYTVVKNLHWGEAKETYMSQLALKEQEYVKDYFIFEPEFQLKISNYYNLQNNNSFLIIQRTDNLNWKEVSGHWLAFNPTVARYLGWQPCHNRLLGWQDSKGNFMAASIYWANGYLNMFPPHLYSDAGAGWLVVVSPLGFKQIQETFLPKFYWQQKIHRANNTCREGKSLKRFTRLFF
ncbi:MAG: hypothetical protein RLZZ628_2850 [Bacteroidota bacterium]|jgi:hypothetical protein